MMKTTALHIIYLLLILAVNVKSETNTLFLSSKKGFSAKEMGVFLDQTESHFAQDERITGIAVIGRLMEVTTVKNTTEQKQRFYFEKINEEWNRKSVDSHHADPIQPQKIGMSIKEIGVFFVQVEGLFPKDEGIVGVEMFEKQIKLKTAIMYVPLAGRGHIITFEKADEGWLKVAESEWMS